MLKAPIPHDEAARLQCLYEYGILDTPEEDDFNDIVRLASKTCNTPISSITLLDGSRQWFKARLGLKDTESRRDQSFCGHAILNGAIFIVPDATKDERFRDNPIVTGDPNVRFYAGVPLLSARGYRLGTLCVIDRIPRTLDKEQQEVLIVLGKQVVKLLELHKKNEELKKISLLERTQRIELERIVSIQKKMIAIMAHDIRSPLHSLKSLLQLIPDKKNGLSQPGLYLEMAAKQLNATLGLLDNLVDWGQMQLSAETRTEEDQSLYKIVQEVFAEAATQARLKGLVLYNGIDPGEHLKADGNILRFILRNLVNNSVKFTKAGGIGITAEAAAGQAIEITVEDTGIGMPEPILEKLFYGQKKISRKGTQHETGSGLGLSLVKESVDKMEGTIHAKSTEGKGTRITVILPSRYPQ